MVSGWQSEILGSAELAPRDCSVRAAQALDHASETFTSLVELHLLAIDAALVADRPGILAEQLRWERARLATIAPHIDAAVLHDACMRVLNDSIGPNATTEIEAMCARARADVDRLPPLPPDARDPRVLAYLERVLDGDRHGALEVVMRAADGVEDVTEVMLDLLQPAQRAIGRAWEQGSASVAQEHFGTAITQQSLAMLYPRLFTDRLGARRLVAVGVDAHEVGLRIVTDILEHRGWQTTYLGSGVPTDDVIERLVTLEADLVAISASMPSELGALRDLVTAIRADPRCDRVRIIVGGRLITMAPDLIDWLGADGWAADARDVASLCDRLMENGDARV
jgi:methanogenic corrinoid protein MtbC1